MNVRGKKGILKGLKHFSHLFEEEEKDEIQIGLPTDVKHVAHIGWDGPSANPPSWMDEFRSQNGGYTSAPLDGVASAQKDDTANSQDKGQATESSAKGRSVPGLPRTSRRHASMDNIIMTDDPSGVGNPRVEPIESSGGGGRRRQKDKNKKKKKKEDSSDNGDDEAPSSLNINRILPDIPKKVRKKKPKDADGSVKSKRGMKQGSDSGPDEDRAVSSSGSGAGLAIL